MADDLDLLTTWGREFCIALGPDTEATGQDAYEAFSDAFDQEPTLDAFAAMGAAEVSALTAAARALLEDSSITDAQMRAAVDRTLALAR